MWQMNYLVIMKSTKILILYLGLKNNNRRKNHCNEQNIPIIILARLAVSRKLHIVNYD